MGAAGEAVGGMGRAPGCGGGGREDCVVVAGVERGVVRVGVGSSREAVCGVRAVGLEAAMGSFLWSWIGGMVDGWCEGLVRLFGWAMVLGVRQ